jgi:2-polyprenyl-3-methyl-5-hydroxy-6-metoxy-1,4-benzoquinol methylase
MTLDDDMKKNRKEYFETENYLDPNLGYPERNIDWFTVNILNDILKLPFVDKNKNLLDVGCAHGYFTRILSNHFKFTMGIDLAENRIEYAKNYEKETLLFKQQDLTEDDFESKFNKKFDLLFSNAVIPHIPINLKIKTFENLAKISNAGAYFVMYDGLCENGCLDQFVGLFSIDWLKDNIKDWEYVSHDYICPYTFRIVLRKIA